MLKNALKYDKRSLVLLFFFFPFVSSALTQSLRFPDGQVVKMSVEREGAYLITEGDVLLSKSKGAGAVVIDKVEGSRWPNNRVPFKISSALHEESRLDIYRAMLEISNHTHVKFKELSEEDIETDFVEFTPSDTTVCASHVGRLGGRQNIVLAPRCKKGSIMHEILHALGFWHEQSRADRDNHIRIVWENIKEEKQYNFSKHVIDGLDINEYDYDSIMHYNAKAFSKNGEDTIIPLVSGKQIGQRVQLSQNDIKTLNILYPIINRD